MPPVAKEKLNEYIENHSTLAIVLAFMRRVVMTFPYRGAEMLLSSIAAATGFWIGWPWGNIYQSDALYYKILVQFMPAWAWTLLFLIPAAPSAFLVGRHRRCRRLRFIGNCILLSVWVLASMLFAHDHAPYLATAWTPVFAFYQAWTLLAFWLKLDDIKAA